MIRSFIKAGGVLMPCDPPTKEALERMKQGSILTCDWKKKNNPAFHRKLFALFNYAFEYWEPGEITSEYGVPEKNFERFRDDLVILAGFFIVVTRLDGTIRVEAKSLSFGKMDDDERAQVYQKVLTVVMEKLMPQFTGAEIEETANKYWNQLIEFA